MGNIKVGLIGYGLSGSVFHAPIIRSLKGFELVKVVSSDPDKVHKDLAHVEVVANEEQLLNDAGIELVVIAAPNLQHYDLAKRSLEAGKHTIVEKPFVIESAEGEELIRLAKQKNKIISVYHNRRWDNDFLTIRSLIEHGKLGDIYTYEAHYDRYRPEVRDRWREQSLQGSGVLYDLGSHLIDQALCLFGFPEFVTADVLSQRHEASIDDYFHIVLGYGRMRVILHSGSIVKNPGPHFQIHGSKGSFVKYGLDSQEDALKSGLKPGAPLWGMDREEWYGELTFGEGDTAVKTKVETIPGSYEAYYTGMYEAIRNRQPAPVTAEEALHVIRVIEAAMKSSKEHNTVYF
ncbi:oxidoreductase [Paenibacillus thalictri]|uniref:Oxidoreductase n=1 Tax=Paenibacillus thalictri TaxID=2527873 RepID=A0A4Q9DU71_9BACL|nr:oxidoreductase [Paenibacillus thalictri]TBL79896.1 oxidoreductase [Paenibacillus thalictri]